MFNGMHTTLNILKYFAYFGSWETVTLGFSLEAEGVVAAVPGVVGSDLGVEVSLS